jgi:FAD-linked sulfhydryl oxidase
MPFGSIVHSLNVLFQLLIASVGFLNPRSRTYMDPWTGDFFGEGGVERYLHVQPTSDVVRGDVIMTKLGNATAK